MCRNIRTLFNFDPPVTEEEIRAASLQFVRKISGFTKPSKANELMFMTAVDEVAGISTRLLQSLETNAPPKNREEEAAKAKARAAERFGEPSGHLGIDLTALAKDWPDGLKSFLQNQAENNQYDDGNQGHQRPAFARRGHRHSSPART